MPQGAIPGYAWHKHEIYPPCVDEFTVRREPGAIPYDRSDGRRRVRVTQIGDIYLRYCKQLRAAVNEISEVVRLYQRPLETRDLVPLLEQHVPITT